MIRDRKKDRSSFLKKRSKKLLFAAADSRSARAKESKGFLVLFFKKEHSCLLAGAFALGLASTARAADPPQVIQKDRQFSPTSLTVAPGTVTFVNQDDVTHNISITGPDGSAMWSHEENPGDTHSVELTQEGTYKVTCLIHPKMKLTIQVQSPGK